MDLVQQYKVELHGWLFTIQSRLFQKLGGDLLGSVHAKILRVLEKVRECFPLDYQFQQLCKILVDANKCILLNIKVRFFPDILAKTYFHSQNLTRLAIESAFLYIETK